MVSLYVEFKEQNERTNKIETDLYTCMQRTDWWLPEGRGIKGLGEKGKGSKKCKLVVPKQSWGCKAQHREYRQ